MANDTLKEQADLLKDLRGMLGELEDAQSKIEDNVLNQNDALNNQVGLFVELNKIANDYAKIGGNTLSFYKSIVNYGELQLGLENAILNNNKHSVSLMQDKLFDEMKSLSLLTEGNVITKIGVDMIKLSSDNVKRLLTGYYDIDTANKNIYKGKKLELKLDDSIFESTQKLLKAQKEQEEILKKQQNLLKSVETKHSEWLTKIKTGYAETKVLLTSVQVSAMFLAGALLTKIIGLTKAIRDTRYEFGLSLSDTVRMGATLTKITTQVATYGGTTEDVAKAWKAVLKETTNTNLVTASAASNVVKMMNFAGLTAEQGAKINTLFYRIGGNSQDIADNMTSFVMSLAKNNGGDTAAVMSDIAENANTFARLNKTAAKNLIEATVAANQLGVSMKNIVSAGEAAAGNIDSFIEKSMTAAALTGKSFNIMGYMQAVGTNNFKEQLKYLIQYATTGRQMKDMSIWEVNSMKEQTGLSQEQLLILEQQGPAILNNLDKFKDIAGVEKWSNELTKEKISLWEKLTGFVMKDPATNLLLIGASLNVLRGGIPVLKGIGTWIGTLGSKMNIFSKSTKEVGENLKNIKTPIGGKIKPTVTKPLSAFKTNQLSKLKLEGATTNLLNSKSFALNILSVAGAMIALAGSIWILSKAAMNFDKLTNLGPVAMTMTGLMLALVVSVSALGTAFSNPIAWAGVAGMIAMGAAMWIVSKAAMNFSSSITNISSLINMEFIGQIILFSGAILTLASSLNVLSAAAVGSLLTLPALYLVTKVISSTEESTTKSKPSVATESYSKDIKLIEDKIDKLISIMSAPIALQVDGQRMGNFIFKQKQFTTLGG
ncbi:MAG: hypothetical protein M0R17_08685 [Candidatus Omnitrophica bacterium]|jgi:hypothetical protein|nr:hypothetical protein [Candidatus Omnitrophota bacterium]